MTCIDIETGSEGPKHDPYGYEEITVSRPNDDVVTLHSGLDLWVVVNGERHSFVAVGNFADRPKKEWSMASEMFEKFAGCTPGVARKAYERMCSTCDNCGVVADVYYRYGMPGETLVFCSRCDSIVSVDFNESAII